MSALNSLDSYKLSYEYQEDILGILDLAKLWSHIRKRWIKK